MPSSIQGSTQADVLLVGGGIMSATLALLLHQLDTSLHICMVEQLDDVALESSEALNNAGTGHAGYCELNYTPQDASGNIQIKRALEINAAFEVSLQLWASLVQAGKLKAQDFIQRVPHISAVWGESDIAFLKKRHALLQAHPLFADMRFSQSASELEAWMPLMMQGRKTDSAMAATFVAHGTDINFGNLTRQVVAYLKTQANFSLLTDHQVNKIKRSSKVKSSANNNQKNGLEQNTVQNHLPWLVSVKNRLQGTQHVIESPFVFLGAGGGALPLLQKSGIPEANGYGGFPVSGQWLICQNQNLIKQHHAKVYSLAAVGAPPMSVPHLDTRMIAGKPGLLFGPYAGFTTKFLKQGSNLDLAKSVKTKNIKSLLGAGKHNLDLTKYLIKEVFQTRAQRLETLKQFMPEAQQQDWKLEQAGKRVQIIKQCEQRWGKLEFGTEIVAAQDGSIAALLGASPGASVSVQAMLDVLERCFPQHMQSPKWQTKLKALIPSYGESLIDNANLLSKVRQQTLTTLNLIA